MKQKLSQLLKEVEAFAQTYRAEIKAIPHSGTGSTNCEDDIDEAINALTNALYEINRSEEEEDDEGESYEDHMRFECRQANFV